MSIAFDNPMRIITRMAQILRNQMQSLNRLLATTIIGETTWKKVIFKKKTSGYFLLLKKIMIDHKTNCWIHKSTYNHLIKKGWVRGHNVNEKCSRCRENSINKLPVKNFPLSI